MATISMPSVEPPFKTAEANAPTPVETYLRSMYHPDREYLNGQLLERNVGEKPHARLQRFFILVFSKHESEWLLEVLPEQRVQVGPFRYRVADICVTRIGESTDELIVSNPPVLCIEVLSREDRMSEMQERVDDYLQMGVASVWLVDPWRRRAFTVASSGEIEPVSDQLIVEGTSIMVSVQEMFGELDRYSSGPASQPSATE